MPNPNPHQARKAKKEKRLRKAAKAGTLDAARLTLWNALAAAEDVLFDGAAEAAVRLRAVHAVTQASAAYVKLVEACELEARLGALEKKMDTGGDVL